ncbi:hypothetical protein SDC9_203826 [bioreactor metagenome]|uniref:Uncharacterized protein n=1 Tax=bioreactor metagenome TaxID=1076179 RepID=A0A645IZ16_9ZZZZ
MGLSAPHGYRRLLEVPETGSGLAGSGYPYLRVPGPARLEDSGGGRGYAAHPHYDVQSGALAAHYASERTFKPHDLLPFLDAGAVLCNKFVIHSHKLEHHSCVSEARHHGVLLAVYGRPSPGVRSGKLRGYVPRADIFRKERGYQFLLRRQARTPHRSWGEGHCSSQGP